MIPDSPGPREAVGAPRPASLVKAVRSVLDFEARVLVDVTVDCAIRRLSCRDSQETLAIVAVGPGAWPRLAWRLHSSRLDVCAALLAIPSPAEPRRLIAVDRHVIATVLTIIGRERRLARLFLGAVPGSALAGRLAPTVLIVRRRDAASPLRLQRLVPGADPKRIAVAASRDHDAVIAAWAARGRDPIAYIKIGEVGGEAAALARMGSDAEAAGARVPRVLSCEGNALATTAMAGVSAASVLRRRPARLMKIVERVVDWLLAWHLRAAVPRKLERPDLERHVFAPAQRLSGHLAPGYAEWLKRVLEPLEGRRAALAPAHQDLTMVNVLLSGARLAVLDWETAAAEALPFVDAPYAIADAVAACSAYADRHHAFERCFGDHGGEDGPIVGDAVARIASASGADTAVLSAAFHACWLSHAVNDLRRHGPSGAFVKIAATLSADPGGYDPFAG